MRFALVGFDGDAHQLIAALGSEGRQLTVFSDAGEQAGVVLSLWPAAAHAEWEDVLAARDVDAAIVAARPRGEERDERLRKLVGAGVPLLVIHPACESLVAVELDMIRGEGAAPIMPRYPGQFHPAVDRLAAIVADGEDSPIGRPTQLGFERQGLGEFDAAEQFARDVALIADIAGRIESVSAITPGESTTLDTTTTVNMTTAAGLLARWSATGTDDAAARINLTATRGGAVLEMLPNESAWRLTLEGDSASTNEYADFNGPRRCVERFAALVSPRSKDDGWPAACHHLEVAACADESLRRKRTIDVQPTQHSEEGTFKGLMSLSGCAILLTAVAALLVFAIVEGFRLPFNQPDGPLSPTEDRRLDTHFLIRIWPVYPLLLFLLLQLLRLVFRQPKEVTPSPDRVTLGDDHSNPSKPEA